MSNVTRILLFLAVLAVGASCSDPTEAPSDDTTATKDSIADTGSADSANSKDSGAGWVVVKAPESDKILAQLSSKLLPALCAWHVKCPQVAANGAHMGVYAATETCVHLLESSTSPYRQLAEDVVAGRRAIDNAALDKCVESLKTASCDSGLLHDAPCSGVFVPKVAIGGACRVSLSSTSSCIGGYCRASDVLCPGTCVDPTEAKACKHQFECPVNHVCLASACAKTRSVESGKPCVFGACKKGLFCPSGKSATCRQLPVAGKPCGDGFYCADGAYCQAGTCVARIAQGKACTNPLSCALDHSCTTLFSDASIRSCLPLKKLGDECKGVEQCLGLDTWCKRSDDKSTTGTCTALPGTGESCAPKLLGTSTAPGVYHHTRCRNDLVCNSSSGKCEQPAASGKSCADKVCQAGLRCVGDVCVEPIEPGGYCTKDPPAFPSACAFGNKCLEALCKSVCPAG